MSDEPLAKRELKRMRQDFCQKYPNTTEKFFEFSNQSKNEFGKLAVQEQITLYRKFLAEHSMLFTYRYDVMHINQDRRSSEKVVIGILGNSPIETLCTTLHYFFNALENGFGNLDEIPSAEWNQMRKAV